MKTEIAASLLSADLMCLRDELHRIELAGVDMLHYDVMDGSFVPNIAFGLPMLKAMREGTHQFIDAHLMIDYPGKYVSEFVWAGADMLTFHLESKSDPHDTLEAIHKHERKAAIAIKPGTSARELEPFLDELDGILVMTVEPGFGGQKYMMSMTRKIEEVREMIKGRRILLSVDGGISQLSAPYAWRAGANALVCGSWLFRQENMSEAVRLLRGEAEV